MSQPPLSAFECAVRQHCLDAARVGEPTGYAELAQRLGLDGRSRGHVRRVVDALRRTMRDDHRLGRPYACVAVMNERDALPGSGFAELAWELGRLGPQEDYPTFVRTEWERLQAWARGTGN